MQDSLAHIVGNVRLNAESVATASAEKMGAVIPGAGFGAEESAVLSLGQERLWALSQLEAGRSGQYNIPLGIRIAGLPDAAALRAALDAVAAVVTCGTGHKVGGAAADGCGRGGGAAVGAPAVTAWPGSAGAPASGDQAKPIDGPAWMVVSAGLTALPPEAMSARCEPSTGDRVSNRSDEDTRRPSIQ